MRLLFACTHIAVRYEEIYAGLEAKFEMIPSYGSLQYIPFEKDDYENEVNRLYPYWKNKCTIESHTLESIRRIAFDQDHPPDLSQFQKDIVNENIDVIYIATMLDSVNYTLGWFKGIVIFRCFGAISNFKSYTNHFHESHKNLTTKITKKNYCFMPVLEAVAKDESDILKTNQITLRGYVSNERVPFQWVESNSKPFITTLIKQQSFEAEETYKSKIAKLEKYVNNFETKILGKNSKTYSVKKNINHIGYLNYDNFFSTIAQSRIFLYIGDNSSHLHFTPLEAIHMGVPVFMSQNCALINECVNSKLVSKDELSDYGAFNESDMSGKIEIYFDNITFLKKLVTKQKIISQLFSKKNAVNGFLKVKNLYNLHNKKNPSSERIIKNRFHKMYYQQKVPDVIGEYIMFDAQNFKGQNLGEIYELSKYQKYIEILDTNKAIYARNQLFRKIGKYDVNQGFISGSLINFSQGTYELRLYINNNHSDLIEFLIHVINHDIKRNELKQASFKTGRGYSELKVNFTITKEMQTLTQEIAVYFNNGYDFEFLGAMCHKTA